MALNLRKVILPLVRGANRLRLNEGEVCVFVVLRDEFVVELLACEEEAFAFLLNDAVGCDLACIVEGEGLGGGWH